MHYLKRAVIYVAFLFTVFVLGSTQAFGMAMNDFSLDSQHQALGDTLPGVGYITRTYDDGSTSSASLVAINSEWALTSAHFFNDSSADISYAGGFGSNIFTDPGDIYSIDEYVLHPDWPSGGTTSTRHTDMALVHFSSSLSNVEYALLPDEVPIDGTEFIIGGYGRPATIETQELDFDGQRRAGYQELDIRYGGIAGYPSNIYLSAVWYEVNNPLSAVSTHGDSGGGWFQGDTLIAVNTFATVNYNIGSYCGGVGVYSELDWINQTAVTSEVPLPATIWLFGSVLLAIPIFRRNSVA